MSRVANVMHAIKNVAKLPDGLRFFLFGSCRYAERPADVDVLFIYDPSKLPPQLAYAKCRPLMNAISEASRLPVHPVLLTDEEAQRSDFSARVKAIPLA